MGVDLHVRADDNNSYFVHAHDKSGNKGVHEHPMYPKSNEPNKKSIEVLFEVCDMGLKTAQNFLSRVQEKMGVLKIIKDKEV